MRSMANLGRTSGYLRPEGTLRRKVRSAARTKATVWFLSVAFVTMWAGILTPPVLAQQQPRPRQRLMGVFDLATGEPIVDAEVIDILQKNSILSSKTGTVSLAFLPDGASLVRIQKIGYRPVTLTVTMSPADTVPLTVLLQPLAQLLPTTVTKDSASSYISPALRAFEERRRLGLGGQFIDEAELRKADNRSMTNVVRSIPGIRIDCKRGGSIYTTHKPGECWAVSNRALSRYAAGGVACEIDVYVDGVQVFDNDLEKFRVDQFAAVEFYPGGASIPAQFNKTGSACGILLFWSRER